MSNEKHSEHSQWIEKLEQIDTVPESIAFDKTVAWNKLYSRMDNKPKQNKVMWYWMAAACLLVIIISTFVFRNNNKNDSTITKRQQEKKNLPAIHQDPAIKESPDITKLFIQGSGNTGDKKLADLPSRKKLSPVYEKNVSASLPALVTNTAPVSNISNQLLPKSDSVRSLSLLTPTRKKLRVVHLNELGIPVYEEESTMARYSGRRLQVLNNGKLETLLHPFVIPGNNGNDLIKIKLSPQN